jgi:hypothetical protein
MGKIGELIYFRHRPCLPVATGGFGNLNSCRCKELSVIGIARQSSWQVRVKQDGKGSRGIRIMPLMIVAGKA